MATNLAELALVIRANADSISADIERSIKKSANNFQKIGGTIAASLAVGLGAGMAAVTAAVARGVAQVDNLSAAAQKLGMSTGGLATLEYQAKLTDSSFEGLSAGIAKMQANLATGKANDSIAKLGLDAQKLRALAPEQQFEQIAGALGKIKDNGAQLALGKEIFGKGFLEFANLTEAGADNLRKMADEARILGLILDEGAVAAIGDFNNATNRLTAAWDGFGRQLAGQIAPSLRGLSELIVGAVESMGGMQAVAAGVATGIREIVALGMNAAYGIKLAGAGLEYWALAIQKASLQLGIFTANGLAQALRGIANMAKAFNEVANTAKQAFDIILPIIQNVIIRAANSLSEKITGVIEGMINGFRDGYNTVSGLWGGAPMAAMDLQAPQLEAVPYGPTDGGPSDALFNPQPYKDMADDMKRAGQAMQGMKNDAHDAQSALDDLFLGTPWGEKFKQESEKAQLAMAETNIATQQHVMDIADTTAKANEASQKTMRDAVETTAKQTGSAYSAIQSANREVVSDMVTAWITGTGKMSDIIGQWAQQSLKQIINTLLFAQKSTAGFNGILSGGGGAGGGGGWVSAAIGIVGSLFGGYRAAGGPVSSGKAYMVGEKGPEMFAPKSNGTIIPNRALHSSSASSAPVTIVNQTFQTGVSRIELASVLDSMEERTTAGVVAAYERGGATRRRLRS